MKLDEKILEAWLQPRHRICKLVIACHTTLGNIPRSQYVRAADAAREIQLVTGSQFLILDNIRCGRHRDELPARAFLLKP